ncbi:MAG: hypothetical protein DMG91_16510 [Acidobacteria bacterium]|nr:MAG: hypothetical protein DMG91_16510 [Acidobacteriota bacterium]
MSVRILVVDDDPTIRMLVGRLLRKQSGWEPCGEASNGAEAIEKVEELSPDVVVMDLGMPIMTGLQAARTRRNCGPPWAEPLSRPFRNQPQANSSHQNSGLTGTSAFFRRK